MLEKEWRVRLPEGVSHGHNTLIMLLQEKTQLLMAFYTLKGDRDASCAFK